MSVDTLLLEQAVQLIKHYRDNPSEAHAGAIEKFQHQSEQHARALEMASEYLNALASAPKRDFTALEMMEVKRAAKIEKWKQPGRSVPTALAVVFTIALGWNIGLEYLAENESGHLTVVQTPVVDKHQYATYRQQRKVNLNDGSQISLDWHTEIDVELSVSERLVNLKKGRAVFNVASDLKRPFLVNANGVTTLVTGTEFIVDIRSGDETEVAVLEGSVTVSNKSERVSLNVADRLIATETELKPAERFEVSDEYAWRDGLIVLSDVSLTEAIEVLKPYTSFNIDASRLKGFHGRISATYFINRADDAITGLVKTHNLDVKQNAWDLELGPPVPRRPKIN